ncbi:MAG TPA: hypothetical protein VE083_02435 [Terriglobales bacterium]|nr:hypothetical protein [Terriglobales bacterium]
MPLARIITDSADDSLELTLQLRSRGFQVETVAPGEVPTTPADLEVRLEECNSEDVLTRTAPVSEADDLWVFVAPGALDESVRPIRGISLVAPGIRAPEAKAAPQLAAKSPNTPSVIPFATPEDDPILLELVELQKQVAAGMAGMNVEPRPPNGNGAYGAHPETAAAPAAATNLPAAAPLPEESTTAGSVSEIMAQTEELAVFPTAAESPLHTQPVEEAARTAVPRAASERAPGSSAELRFWRIACVAAALAIAALLLGAHLSRTPESPIGSQTGATTRSESFPSQQKKASVVPPQDKPVVPAPAKPSASAAKAAKPPRAQSAFARKTALSARQALARRRVASAHRHRFIAKDTVVFFDRKGGATARKLKSEPSRKRRSDLN